MQAPRIAYILLWFPKPSETFVFAEVTNLRKMGAPITVFSLYGELTAGLSSEMKSISSLTERLGWRYLGRFPFEVAHWWKREPPIIASIFKTSSLWRWSGLEKTGENLWAVLCGFRLARRFLEDRIQHIHASWASGPATAAWVASRLTGIPFSFSARAWDIHPPDAALGDKMRDAAFVRSETGYNISYLAGFISGDAGKIYAVYNGVPITPRQEAPVHMKPPYKLLALGRFVGKKGFDYLLHACKVLHDGVVDFRLTLAGDGPQRRQLTLLTRKLGLTDRVSFPGFVTYERISDLFMETDVLIMPSVLHASGDRDGIPTVIMESLMHRVPVIATDVAGIAEVIVDGVTGLLIPEKDPQAIVRAVTRMIEDREAALLTATTGRERVRKQFDPDTNHLKMLDLFRKHSI